MRGRVSVLDHDKQNERTSLKVVKQWQMVSGCPRVTLMVAQVRSCEHKQMWQLISIQALTISNDEILCLVSLQMHLPEYNLGADQILQSYGETFEEDKSIPRTCIGTGSTVAHPDKFDQLTTPPFKIKQEFMQRRFKPP